MSPGSWFPSAIRLPVRRRLALAVGCGLIATLVTVAQASVASGIITAVFLARADLHSVARPLAVLAVLALARGLTSWMGRTVAARAARLEKADLRSAIVEHLVRIGPHGVSAFHSGELVTSVVAGVEALDAYVAAYLPQVVLACLAPAIVVVAVLRTDPLSALVLLVTFPLIPIFMVLIGDAARERTRRQWIELSRLSARFLDALHGLRTLAALGASEAEEARIRDGGERYRVMTMRVLRLAFLSALVLELLATLSVAIVAVEIGLRLLYGRMAFQAALFVLMLAPEFYRPLRALGAAFHAGTAGREALARMPTPVGAVPENRGRPASGSNIGGGRVPMASAGQALGVAQNDPPLIRFEEVTFRYRPERAPAIDRLALTIEPRSTLALIGPSGAGKSTVAALLMRLLEPQGGVILADGVPIGEHPVSAWHQRIAWVSQRPHLFHGTVADNLRLGRPRASFPEIEKALARAHALAFVRELPRGWDTPIGERGERLSSGQAQRLAIARAFLRDAPLLVLDEPTSQLDPRNESLVTDSIRELRRNRTVLLIAHRLTTVAQADCIAFLSEGCVTETGTHRELLARGGRYAQLLKMAPGVFPQDDTRCDAR